jgi:hypothetical protein
MRTFWACWTVQAAVGWAVTPAVTPIRRLLAHWTRASANH